MVGATSAEIHEFALEQPFTSRGNERAWVGICQRYDITPNRIPFHCGRITYKSAAMAGLLNYLASFVIVAQSVFSPDILLGCTFACLSTSLCWVYGPFEWDMSGTFLSVAVIFPVTAGISMAFSRREQSLRELATVLANVRGVWEALLTWQVKEDGKWRRLAESYQGAGRRRAYHALFHELCASLIAYFGVPRNQRARHTVGWCLAAREEAEIIMLGHKQRAVVDRGISRMRRLVQDMKVHGLPGGEVHRLDSYVNMTSVAFQRLVALKEYRTPRALRSYARVYIVLMGCLYAPSYLSIAPNDSATAQLGIALAYACVMQIVMGSLFHVLVLLEDPFAPPGESSPWLALQGPTDSINVVEMVDATRQQLVDIEREASRCWMEDSSVCEATQHTGAPEGAVDAGARVEGVSAV